MEYKILDDIRIPATGIPMDYITAHSTGMAIPFERVFEYVEVSRLLKYGSENCTPCNLEQGPLFFPSLPFHSLAKYLT